MDIQGIQYTMNPNGTLKRLINLNKIPMTSIEKKVDFPANKDLFEKVKVFLQTGGVKAKSIVYVFIFDH